jgi:dTDP-glucose 4,6-dehydratase
LWAIIPRIIYNLDALTYAGNLDNVADVATAPNYTFVQEEIIVDAAAMDAFV